MLTQQEKEKINDRIFELESNIKNDEQELENLRQILFDNQK